MFSADLLSRFSLSRFSQQIFSADFFSRSSQQIFSADFLSADFLSRSSQQIFSADLLSRSSQQIFSADLLSRSSQQIFSLSYHSACGQGLSFAVVRGWWSAIVLSFAVVRGWWSAIILSCWWSILHEFFRRTLSRSFREQSKASCKLQVGKFENLICVVLVSTLGLGQHFDAYFFQMGFGLVQPPTRINYC